MRISFLRLSLLGLLLVIAASVMSAFAAGITIPVVNAGQQSVPVTAEDIKPAACAGIYLTQIITGSGMLTGTAGNDLIIGSGDADIIDGLGGNDCILGSAGDDTLTGSEGNDVCLGGSGEDSFTDCEMESQ